MLTMAEIEQIKMLSLLLRTTIKNETNIFSISTQILNLLNSLFELHYVDQAASSINTFNTIHVSNAKDDILMDLHFLHNYILQTNNLKLYTDIGSNVESIDITNFKNIKLLELYNVDITKIKGLQQLRSYLQKMICQRSFTNLEDLLVTCGDDKSEYHCWNELKEASFSDNGLKEINKCIECIPWINVLDLNHNEITNLEPLNCLSCLKHLYLSFNKIEQIPQFKGNICTQLQSLILKNNFIECLSGLQSLTNVSVLDLSNNCLTDHKSLISLSHLATLQYLNLSGNPLSFHPCHRSMTARYLHINIASSPFILDDAALDKAQRKMIGLFHPMRIMKLTSSATGSSLNHSTDKIHRVRQVYIEDGAIPAKKMQENLLPSTLSSSQQYLETKKQIEFLRKEYGDKWLKEASGAALQNMLGLDSPKPAVSSHLPIEIYGISASNNSLNNLSDSEETVDVTKGKQVEKNVEIESESSFLTAFDLSIFNENNTNEDINQLNDIVDETIRDDDDNDNNDHDDDIDLGSEENIYLATPDGESEQIFVVLTNSHICEKECSTSNEKMRWHVNSIVNCQQLSNDLTKIRLEFDTMRKDRKERVYEMELDELKNFLLCIQEKIDQIPKKMEYNYQCIKCLTQFKKKHIRVTDFDSELICPKCDSNLVIGNL